MSEQPVVPVLRDPVMVAAFEGWNDAGEAASAALAHLEQVWKAHRFAEFDPQNYHDFQVNRPVVRTDDDGRRGITWPTTRLSWASPAGAARDVVLVRGIEPSMRWRDFCAELLGHAQRLKVGTLVTLGALLADVPHTRPIPVTSTSEDEDLMRRLALEPSRYEGPTGIVGVLHDATAAAGLPSLSLWAAVPLRRPVAVPEGDSRPAASGGELLTSPSAGTCPRKRGHGDGVDELARGGQ